MQENERPRQSLNRRIMTLVAILMAITAVAVAFISYRSLKSTYLRLYNQKAQDTVRTLAAGIDGERLAVYVETGETDEYYDWLKSEFDRVKEGFKGIQYLYLFYPESDRFIYIVEGIKAGDDPNLTSYLGDVYEYGETEYQYLVPDITAGRSSEALIQGADVGYGQTISAWAPVFDAQGRVAGMVEADCILSDLNAVVRSYAVKIVGVLLLCMLVVLFLLVAVLRRNVTKPIGQLTEMVNSYSHGAMEEKRFRHNDELQWLGTSFTDMTHRIEAYTAEVARVTAEKERIGAELNVATQIQADMLPRIFPAFPERKEFDLYATMDPAKEVGGDFYDFFLVDDDHLGLVMADVSGKGVPAALFMVIAKTLIKNRALLGESPAAALRNVNEQLCEGNEAELFVTVWLAVIEISTGKGVAANAGHEHPVICRADGKYELVGYRHSPAVATMEGIRFREHEFELHPGDRLFVYTDGVPEATDANNELFGPERMLEALNQNAQAEPKELLATVRREIDAFVGAAPQFDDITMLGIHYYGPGEKPVKELTLDATDANLETALAFLDAALEELDCPPKAQMQLDIALEELFVNVAHYAYAPGTGPVTLRLETARDPDSIAVTLIDGGVPYDPLAKPDPDVTLSAEERQIGGLGIYMVKKSMDDMQYEYRNGQNVLTVRKNLAGA